MDYTEKLISTMPVVIRRRVRFGECDPAGIVYTPEFSHFALSAYHWFMYVMLGGPMLTQLRKKGWDSPIKALTFEFRNMLEPDQVFDMTCRIMAIRSRTFDVEIHGQSTTEKPHDIFVAKLSPIMVDPVTKRSVAIPAELRKDLEDYQARQPGGGASQS